MLKQCGYTNKYFRKINKNEFTKKDSFNLIRDNDNNFISYYIGLLF